MRELVADAVLGLLGFGDQACSQRVALSDEILLEGVELSSGLGAAVGHAAAIFPANVVLGSQISLASVVLGAQLLDATLPLKAKLGEMGLESLHGFSQQRMSRLGRLLDARLVLEGSIVEVAGLQAARANRPVALELAHGLLDDRWIQAPIPRELAGVRAIRSRYAVGGWLTQSGRVVAPVAHGGGLARDAVRVACERAPGSVSGPTFLGPGFVSLCSAEQETVLELLARVQLGALARLVHRAVADLGQVAEEGIQDVWVRLARRILVTEADAGVLIAPRESLLRAGWIAWIAADQGPVLQGLTLLLQALLTGHSRQAGGDQEQGKDQHG